MIVDELTQEIVEHLRAVLGTTLDSPVRVVPATLAGRAWSVRLAAAESPAITLAFDEAGATALAALIGGHQESVPVGAVQAALYDLCSHTVAALAATWPPATAGGADISPPEPVEWSGTATTVAGLACAALPVPLVVAVSGTGASARRHDPAPAEPARAAAPAGDARLDVLLDIDLPLVVRFGCTDMPLKALSRLGPGSLIDLSRAPDDPVEMLVGGRVVARGEVVVVSGSYGIRVVDVAGERERARGTEA